MRRAEVEQEFTRKIIAAKQLAQVRRAEAEPSDFAGTYHGKQLAQVRRAEVRILKPGRIAARSNLHKCAEQKQKSLVAGLKSFEKQLAQVRRAEVSFAQKKAEREAKQLAQVRRAEVQC